MLGNTKGFTVTELIITITAGTLVALVLLSISLFFYADIMRGRVETTMLVESQTILRRVVEDLRYASGILDENNIPDSNEPTDGWVTSNDDLILIIQSPALSTAGGFTYNENTGNPYQNEFIYFTDGTNLYKRILAHPAATDNRTETSCPEGATGCSRNDPVFTSDFNDMYFTFYDQNGDVTTDPTLGRSIKITIELERNVFGQTIDVLNEIRVTLRNPYLE